MTSMDLRHLRYYLAVAEELSYSKAAHRLRIAQPALSRAVQELEHDIGTPLIDRSHRQIQLTPAGAVMRDETSLLLQRLDDSLRKVRRTASGEEAELRLGYIGPPTKPFLGRILAEFRKRYPRVTVTLEERTPERVWERVSQNRLALGLTRPVFSHSQLGLRSQVLRQERLCAAVAANHRWAEKKSVPWKSLATEPLILLARREGAGSHDTILNACARAKFTPRIVHSPSLIGTVLQYVESGTGIGIVPDSIVSPDDPLIRRVPLTPAEHLPLVLVWKRDNAEPAAQAFRDLAIDWLRRGELWPRCQPPG